MDLSLTGSIAMTGLFALAARFAVATPRGAFASLTTGFLTAAFFATTAFLVGLTAFADAFFACTFFVVLTVFKVVASLTGPFTTVWDGFVVFLTFTAAVFLGTIFFLVVVFFLVVAILSSLDINIRCQFLHLKFIIRLEIREGGAREGRIQPRT